MSPNNTFCSISLSPGIYSVLYAPVDLELVLLVETIVQLFYEHDCLVGFVLLELFQPCRHLLDQAGFILVAAG